MFKIFLALSFLIFQPELRAEEVNVKVGYSKELIKIDCSVSFERAESFSPLAYNCLITSTKDGASNVIAKRLYETLGEAKAECKCVDKLRIRTSELTDAGKKDLIPAAKSNSKITAKVDGKDKISFDCVNKIDAEIDDEYAPSGTLICSIYSRSKDPDAPPLKIYEKAIKVKEGGNLKKFCVCKDGISLEKSKLTPAGLRLLDIAKGGESCTLVEEIKIEGRNASICRLSVNGEYKMYGKALSDCKNACANYQNACEEKEEDNIIDHFNNQKNNGAGSRQ